MSTVLLDVLAYCWTCGKYRMLSRQCLMCESCLDHWRQRYGRVSFVRPYGVVTPDA